MCADLTELSLPSNIHINFPEGKEKPMHFEITIKPDEGYYRNGKFLFDFQISTGYPYDAPKVKCKTKVKQAQQQQWEHHSGAAAAAAAADASVASSIGRPYSALGCFLTD
jgi:hypothetical protein